MIRISHQNISKLFASFGRVLCENSKGLPNDCIIILFYTLYLLGLAGVGTMCMPDSSGSVNQCRQDTEESGIDYRFQCASTIAHEVKQFTFFLSV